MDKISIIVPVYKVEAYLDRCVESIVNQTYQNLEIILVDDGSPDTCGAMCDAWAEKDSRIRVIHKPNGGLSDARNAGMEIATGEYIGFVDSDDWIHCEFVATLYAAIKKFSVNIAACDYLKTDESTIIIDESIEINGKVECYNSQQTLNALLNNNLHRAVAWNKLYHKSLLVNMQYPIGKYHEDEYFAYRVLGSVQRTVYVNIPLYYYFNRQGSIMNSVSLKHIDVLGAYLERVTYLKEYFPMLYVKDKVIFCKTCVNLYLQSLHTTASEYRAYRESIRQYRKQIQFSVKELIGLSFRDIVYVIGSRISLQLLCLILKRKRGHDE